MERFSDTSSVLSLGFTDRDATPPYIRISKVEKPLIDLNAIKKEKSKEQSFFDENGNLIF
jgi:hypothetical protein